MHSKIFYKNTIAVLFLFLLMGILSACKNNHRKPTEITRAMYYWKSTVQLTPFEKQLVKKLAVRKLYLKYFDVDWDKALQEPVPVAKIRITEPNDLQQIEVIPTVFITNECMFKIDSTQTTALAKKIIHLINSIHKINGLNNIKEIQIDCDWTAKTKQKYFDILKKLTAFQPNIIYSATIRLHQIKYRSLAGVPPVNKGLLMCYNMGNLKDPTVKNSILDADEFKKYIQNLNSYPLPLDVALPLFEWAVLFREGKYVGLMSSIEENALNSRLFSKSANHYTVLKDSVWKGYRLQKADKIRLEKSSFEEIKKIEKLLSKPLKNQPRTISLFHLDSVILNKKSYEQLEDIYTSLH